MAGTLSFLINHADGTQRAFCGLPLVHPAVITFVAAPGEEKHAATLAASVESFLLGLGPHVQECPPPGLAQGGGIQLLVVVAREGEGALPPAIPNLNWWVTGGDDRRVLPVFGKDQHPDKVLPKELQKYNAAFWDDSVAEVTATVLSASGLAPESHRIFISYRRLETEPLAEDLFETLNRLGFNVFLDRFAVPPAANFQRRLHHDLAEKAMVLLLESDRFSESTWCTEEITYCKRYELGLFALRMPWGMGGEKTATKKMPDVPDEWRKDLTRADFVTVPKEVEDRGSKFMQWGRLTDAARATLSNEIRARHDAALLRRRENMRTQMLTELARRKAAFQERADGLVAVEGKDDKKYAVWLSPRPPELPDFHATHTGCQFPEGTIGVIVGLRSLLEPQTLHRLKWLSGVCKLVLVDQGHIVSASRKIAEGTL